MRYAIIQNGGKQYKAVEGETIEIDTVDGEAGKKVELDHVLLVSDGETVTVGKPTVDGAKVAATVVEHDRGPKISVFKYKPKIRYRVKTGHRQALTRLMIDSIDIKGESRPAKAEAAKEPAAKAAPKPRASAKRGAKAKAATKTKAKKK